MLIGWILHTVWNSRLENPIQANIWKYKTKRLCTHVSETCVQNFMHLTSQKLKKLGILRIGLSSFGVKLS